MDSPFEASKILADVQNWVDSFVAGMNLCPFAKPELTRNRVRFVVSAANSEELLLTALHAELELLNNDQSIETTLLIHPGVLREFDQYNQFLNYAEALIIQMALEGIYQIASFHPDYQFENTDRPTLCYICYGRKAWKQPSPAIRRLNRYPAAILN